MANILVVDDSKVDRARVAGLLKKNPELEVLEAADGAEALEQIELHVPDLVLTDLQMEPMNGLELTRTVREKYPLIPVILMTSKGSEKTAVEALLAGAASYVNKAWLHSDLLETVERVLAVAAEDRNFVRLTKRMTECRFVLENDLSLLSSLVNYLRKLTRDLGLFDESECLRLGTALDEALTNAYYHGNLEVSSKLREEDHSKYHELARQRRQQLPYSERRIFVHAVFSEDEARFTVRDEGPGFNWRDLPDPTDPANLERPCGRGILLMRAFTDQLEFNEAGNEVTLIKRRKPIGAHELVAASAAQ